MINCVIAGVGGQGTILAARLLGMAALECGLDVRGSETIGMAQRGGCVTSHIRMGHVVNSPLIPHNGADVIIAFEPGEAVRAQHFLSPDGTLIVCDKAVWPSVNQIAYDPSAMLEYLRKTAGKLIIVNGKQTIQKIGDTRCLNVALLGAAIDRGMFPFTVSVMEDVIRLIINRRFVDMNINALSAAQVKECYNSVPSE